VLAPHPDDEILGCGAAIMRKVAAGTDVTVVVFADGRGSHESPYLSPDELAAMRRAELAEAAHRLGLPERGLRHLTYADDSLTQREDEITDVIADFIDELKPDEVYVTGIFEPHPDHSALGRAARRAVRWHGDRGPLLLEYPVHLWVALGARTASPANLRRVASAAAVFLRLRRAVAISTEPFTTGKLFALDAHVSQLRRPDVVPPDQPWPGLATDYIVSASDSVEMFFPLTSRTR
jgi:LmbE family N-acetylglucosaminyl deacetylase